MMENLDIGGGDSLGLITVLEDLSFEALRLFASGFHCWRLGFSGLLSAAPK
jgi:hypothetical protein